MRRTSRFHPDNAIPFNHDPSMPWYRRDGRRERHHAAILMQPYEDTSAEDLKEKVQEALYLKLSPLERAVVECVVDGGYSLQETAYKLGLKAKSHIYRTRERAFAKLRDALSEYKDTNGDTSTSQRDGAGIVPRPDIRTLD